MDTFPLESTWRLGYTRELCVALQECPGEHFKQETHQQKLPAPSVNKV